MKKKLKKDVFRFFTSKTWRWNKRNHFFQEIFWDLKEKPDGVDWGSFSSVEDVGSSYERSCREMARTHDYNPHFDLEYGEMNLAKYFNKYQLQRFDSLYAVIERVSYSRDGFLKRSATFKVKVFGRESGVPFAFQYFKNVKFWFCYTIQWLLYNHWIFCY